MKQLIICGHKYQYFDHYYYFKYLLNNNILEKNNIPNIVARYWRGEKYGLPPIRISEIYKTKIFKKYLKLFLNIETVNYNFIWVDKYVGLKPFEQIINKLNNNETVILFLKYDELHKTKIYDIIKKTNILNIICLKYKDNNISHNNWNFNHKLSDKKFKEELFLQLF